MKRPAPEPSDQPEKPQWITEHGDFVPAARVTRVRYAQEVLNIIEETVYNALWKYERPIESTDFSRTVRLGYGDLARLTKLCTKTVQRVIAKLIEKEFAEVHTPADILSRTPTIYTVFGYGTVLKRQTAKGKINAAKIGPGFTFVREENKKEINRHVHSRQVKLDMSTVDRSKLHLSTVDSRSIATMDSGSTLPYGVQETSSIQIVSVGSSTVRGRDPKNGEDEPKTVENSNGNGFHSYIEIFTESGKPMNAVDITRAEKFWATLSLSEQLEATSHARKICEEASAPRYIPIPRNHLADRPWTRVAKPVEPKVKTPKKRAIDLI